MPAQPLLAQLDLSELEDCIPEQIRSIVLVSNAELELCKSTLELIKTSAPCLFVHHNTAKNLDLLRRKYPTNSCEMLFIRGNGIGYWGLKDSTGEPFYSSRSDIQHCGIFALRGQLDLSNRPEIQKINLSWLTTLEQQEHYPHNKRPSTGFYTRKLFEAVGHRRANIQVCTLGFSPDPGYWNNSMTHHHDFSFEAKELHHSEQLQRHHPLDRAN